MLSFNHGNHHETSHNGKILIQPRYQNITLLIGTRLV